MEYAGLLPHQESANRPKTLTKTRGPAIGDGRRIAKGSFEARGEIEFDIRPDLTPSGRGASVKQQPGLSRTDVKRRAARVCDRVVERNIGQESGAAHPVLIGIGLTALPIERTAGARTVQ